MAVDYDLIIFGATSAGVEAAIAAATLKARVALITQGFAPSTSPESISHQALLHLAHRTESMRQMQTLPLWSSPILTASPTLVGERVDTWLRAIESNVETMHSGAVLASQGVDVIAAMGEFCRKPAMGVRVGDRFLQARGYLLATEAQIYEPDIPGLKAVGYLTPKTLPNKIATLTTAKVVVIGSGKTAVELAQTLIRFGLETTLLTQEPCLLPKADRDISQFIQVQLEAEGVRLLLNTRIDQIREHTGRKQLLIGSTILNSDEIILATDHTPNLASLNLEAAGVEWNTQNLPHNARLQTTNPRIYICEGRFGNDYFAQVAAYEAAIALKNILGFPLHQADYRSIPLTIHTSPELAWIGLREDQALQTYGSRKVYILHHPLHPLLKAQLNDLTGFCKLIVHQDGTLLGAHIAGHQASEWIGIVAIAMQQRLKIGAIANLSLPSLTLAEILREAASDFRSHCFKRRHWLQDLTDHFFDLRRAWARN